MKRDLPIKKVPTELEVLHFPAPGTKPVGPLCLNCSLPLFLSQPDLDAPERLLGVCGQCKSWFLVDLIPDQRQGIIWRLPDIEVIQRLSVESPPKKGSKRRNPSEG
jgi:hypothetical protein